MKAILLALIIIVNIIYIIRLIIDLTLYKRDIHADPGNSLFLAISSIGIFFFSAFGISDFAIATTLYRMKKWVEDKKLPGTLNTQCVIPVAVMALTFISVVKVNTTTLVVCILFQVIGSYIGPDIVAKLSATVIRRIVSVGLIIAALFILVEKFKLFPTGGMANGLSGVKLIIAAICMFIFGILNNIGIGSYPLVMATIYALGMNPIAAFPVMMGASAFSVPISSLKIIKYGQYSRKITLFTSIFGVVGVLVGVFSVKKLDVSMLQYIVIVILLYSGISALSHEFKINKT
ncbi:MAG: hypothetical protein ORN24_01670 [Burkholderiales bacterium]|nr:hypothetical protein [Burkholderiales bacterium]